MAGHEAGRGWAAPGGRSAGDAASAEVTRRRPNVLLLLSDEHSFRFLGAVPPEEGGEPVATPTLDRLANDGVRFESTYCQVALCTPSRMSMLTGLEPRECGAWWNDSVLRPELPTIASELGEAGYSTCLVGKMHLGGTNQFAGFQERPYGDLTGATGHQWEPLRDAEVGPYSMRTRTADAGVTEIPESQLQENIACAEALSFVRESEAEDPERPWFLCVSFSRPHFPLTAPRRHFSRYWPDGTTPPRVGASGHAYDHPMSVGQRAGFEVDAISEEEEMMRARAGYFACVTFLDEVIGDLLARMEHGGFLDDTVVVYTSDHGEMAGEHGTWWKQGWYEACTRVPLIISTPDHRSGEGGGRVVRTPVALLDLYPTLCGLVGLEPPRSLPGQDLSAAVRGGVEPEPVPVTSDNLVARWGEGTEFRMIRRGDHKYVHFRDAPPLLFNVVEDPGEQRNLIDSVEPRDLAARKFLEAQARETMDFGAAEKERLERDGPLVDKYRLDLLAEPTGNLYMMGGRLVNAEGLLYEPVVVVDDVNSALTGRGARDKGSRD